MLPPEVRLQPSHPPANCCSRPLVNPGPNPSRLQQLAHPPRVNLFDNKQPTTPSATTSRPHALTPSRPSTHDSNISRHSITANYRHSVRTFITTSISATLTSPLQTEPYPPPRRDFTPPRRNVAGLGLLLLANDLDTSSAADIRTILAQTRILLPDDFLLNIYRLPVDRGIRNDFIEAQSDILMALVMMVVAGYLCIYLVVIFLRVAAWISRRFRFHREGYGRAMDHGTPGSWRSVLFHLKRFTKVLNPTTLVVTFNHVRQALASMRLSPYRLLPRGLLPL
ncbi:hypothetical protein Cob_v003281 [Colletotrichum orbiculare MAFF 240422]|uniref:Uncharacterized protein n=1 Tax=Colletotrichum orbiculare (strain 104-T / ATCC 96160 / CBS 514.97 / LARS 414 / MAFF 240422) TaxID=1213857 RepID=A0A484G3J2_COLOR|nr:hypothetical protein Cob_v003281 [Colletotrichum orbiculare MAFF 240422]